MIVYISLVAETGVDAFELAGYCRQLCLRGRGGNLCKCNAVHFAGKRDGGGSEDDYLDQSLPDGDYLAATEMVPSVEPMEKQLVGGHRTLYERLKGADGGRSSSNSPSHQLAAALAALQTSDRASKARTLE